MTSILTRNSARIVGLVAVFAITAGSLAAGETVKSTNNGAYMVAQGTDSSGCVSLWLYVGRSGTKAAPTTWMNYSVYDMCAGQSIGSGDGVVPNTTFKITGNRNTLTITPSAVAGFNTQGLTGQIKATVTADGLYSSTYSGHSRWEYAGHVSQSHGMWTSQSATVSGNLLGFQFGSAAGSIGENRDRQMQIDRGTK